MILPILPVTLLILALGSVFLYQNAVNEVYRVLAASIIVVCLIWGFAIAHWSIHLLCLIFLFKMPSPSAFLETVKIDK